MDRQEQESLWKSAGVLAQRMAIRKLSMQIKQAQAHGEKIEIPHVWDKPNNTGKGDGRNEGDRA